MRSFKENFLFVAICVAVAAIFYAAILAAIENRTNFEEICSQQGGAVAFDGRQNQCIKRLS